MLMLNFLPPIIIVGFATLIAVIAVLLIVFKGKPVTKETADAPRIHYTRLPGRGLRREGLIALTRTWCTLWLTDDHILSVDNHVFSEDYKRFYFRDIQAIVFSKTRRGAVWNMVLSIFVALWLLTMFSQEAMEWRITWLIVAVLFIVLLVINIVRGPTCKCQLMTAVHKETLPSLNRMNTTERVLGTLRQRIRQAQRDLVDVEAQE